MAPLAFTEPGARIALNATVGLWVLSELRIRIRSHSNRAGTRIDRGSILVVIATVFAGVAGAITVARGDHGTIAGARWAVFVAGLVLMVAGIALRQWAVASLGRFFTLDVRVQPGQTVVEQGPYRWVRHPSYTGMIVTFVGLGLALGSWASLALLAVLPTAGLVYRIHFEERALLDSLGEAYRRFAAGRPRLFPACGDSRKERRCKSRETPSRPRPARATGSPARSSSTPSPCPRSDSAEREQRPLHARRAHRLAHAPERPDDLGHGGRRPLPAARRPGRGDPPRRPRLLRARRGALARRRGERFMTHLAMVEVDEEGHPATWGEHVTDEEYAAAPALD